MHARINPDRDALFLDLDGTILDIVERPDAVQPAPGTMEMLNRLAERFDGALAFVSGRPIRDIDRISSPFRFAASGVHGAELRITSAGPIEEIARPLPPTLRERLRALATEPGILVEDKTLAVAVHYRMAEPDVAERVRARVVSDTADFPGLQLLNGKCLVEVKTANLGKGAALQRFMQTPPFQGRRPVFAGDDITDEDAFAQLPRWRGLGIAVGQARAGADVLVSGPAELRRWLGEVVTGQSGS